MRQIAVAFIVLATLLPTGSCQNPEPDYPPPGGDDQIGQGADQGWNYGTAQAWYHVDQGTAFFPYDWFIALEQAEGHERFRRAGQHATLRLPVQSTAPGIQPRRSADRVFPH
jgi:hypothetical protein